MKKRSFQIRAYGFLVVCLFAFWGCKSGGPATPYDVPRPPVEGDLLVQAFDKGSAVTNAVVKVLDPTGNTLTGVTDNQGQVTFPFDYQLYQQTQLPPFWVTFPTQGVYYLSRVNHIPVSGRNTVTFWSNDNVLEPVPQNGVTYAYNLQNNVVFDLEYHRPGNLSVPISLSTQGLPEGWTATYENNYIGETITSSAVTVTVPAHSHKEPILDFIGLVPGATTAYVDSLPITIKRGFQIPVVAFCSWTLSIVNLKVSANGYWNVDVGNCEGSVWTGYLHVGMTGVNHSAYESQPVTFSPGASNKTWVYDGDFCVNGNCTGTVYIEIGITNPDVGTFIFQKDTGVRLSSPTTVVFPTQTL